MNENWINEPSVEICATECGAKCCKNGFIYLLDEEMRRLKRLGKVKVLRSSQYWVLDFKTNGGQCPFLDEANACTIHEQRPLSCQRFPRKPYEDCLVWPKDGVIA